MNNEPMNQTKTTTLHMFILLAAILLAFSLRFIRLGELPLSNREAAIALQALAVAQDGSEIFGPHTAYVGLTGGSFFLFEAGNFLARFWPALLGALAVLIPTLWRDALGLWPATGLSILLAFSPEMVSLSRIIGSPVVAFVGLLFALGLFMKGKTILAGMVFAFGLMTGPGFWMGVLILTASFLAARWLSGESALFPGPSITGRAFRTRTLPAFGVTLLVVGTAFFLEPALLSGVFTGLVDFLRGFGLRSGVSPSQILLSLVAYAAPAVVFGIWGTIRGVVMRDRLDNFLSLWWALALFLILLYPSRNTADILWITFPLWVLSARVLSFAWQKPDSDRPVMIITALLVVVVFGFMTLSLRTLVSPTLEPGRQLNFFLALAGGVVLLVATVLLVSYGWTEKVALPGLLLGLVIVFTAGQIAVSVNATGLAPEPPEALWYPLEPNLDPELMLETLARVRDWNASGGEDLNLVVSDVDLPGLRWALLGIDSTFVPALPTNAQPAFLVTPVTDVPQIANSYRGQDLVWSKRAAWFKMDSYQLLYWLITRETLLMEEARLILWVRADLMPDSQFN